MYMEYGLPIIVMSAPVSIMPDVGTPCISIFTYCGLLPWSQTLTISTLLPESEEYNSDTGSTLTLLLEGSDCVTLKGFVLTCLLLPLLPVYCEFGSLALS